jgi:hypothetical protein
VLAVAGIAGCGTPIASVEQAMETSIVEVNKDRFTSTSLLGGWLTVFPHEAKI